MTVSPSAPASGLAPMSTLIPGMIPRLFRSSGNGVPSEALCRIVSSNRITPLMNSSAPSVVKSSSRYPRRFSSVDSTPIESKRFLIVPSLSSAARIPFPGATSAFAISSRLVSVMVAMSGLLRSLSPARLSPLLSYPGTPARGRSSVGRASASQAEGRGFEPRRPLSRFPGRRPAGRAGSRRCAPSCRRAVWPNTVPPAYRPRSDPPGNRERALASLASEPPHERRLAGEIRASGARFAHSDRAPQRDRRTARASLEGDASAKAVAAGPQLQASSEPSLERSHSERALQPPVHEHLDPSHSGSLEIDTRSRRTDASAGGLPHDDPGAARLVGIGWLRARAARAPKGVAVAAVVAAVVEAVVEAAVVEEEAAVVVAVVAVVEEAAAVVVAVVAVVAAVVEVGRWRRRRRWRWWRWRWWRRRWWWWRRWRWWWRRLDRLVVAEVQPARPGRVRSGDRAPATGKQTARCGTGASRRAVVRIRASHVAGRRASACRLCKQRLPEHVGPAGRADVVDHVLTLAVGDGVRLVGGAHAVVVVVGPDHVARQARLAWISKTVGIDVVELRARGGAGSHGERARLDVVLKV